MKVSRDYGSCLSPFSSIYGATYQNIRERERVLDERNRKHVEKLHDSGNSLTNINADVAVKDSTADDVCEIAGKNITLQSPQLGDLNQAQALLINVALFAKLLTNACHIWEGRVAGTAGQRSLRAHLH